MKKALPPIRGVVEAVATLSLLATLVIVVLELSANERAIRSATASDVALSLSSWYSDVTYSNMIDINERSMILIKPQLQIRTGPEFNVQQSRSSRAF